MMKDYLTFQKFKLQYHLHLTNQQETAVRCKDPYILLLAVPGSGKTTVLIHRLAYMIQEWKIDSRNILALTYNKAAAEEMKTRFEEKFTNLSSPKFQTLNSFCYGISLYFFSLHPNASRNLQADTTSLVRNLIIRVWKDSYPDDSDVKETQRLISYCKNMMLKEEDIHQLDTDIKDFSEIYALYKSEMKNHHWMDYDDQLVIALWILRHDAQLLRRTREKYSYICVDEAQDTSRIQHILIHLLAKDQHIFMCGDEDQSIYGFRGAYPDALLKFEKQYPGGTILRMEENFRSTKEIIEPAQKFIEKSKHRYPKTMFTISKREGSVKKYVVTTQMRQYHKVVDLLKQNEGTQAVLYRSHDSSIVLADLLLKKNIPFRLKKTDQDFFNQKSVRDVVAFLNLVENPFDFDALRVLANKGLFYLKKDKIEEVVSFCERHRQPFYKGLFEISKRMEGYQKSKIRDFNALVRSCRYDKPPQAIKDMLESGYEDYLNQKQMDHTKAEALLMLSYSDADIPSFLEHLKKLETDMKQKTLPDAKIVLSTVHASKGLEYDSVYLIDLMEGSFPSIFPDILSQEEVEKLREEERRLFYVALTRAKTNLSVFAIEKETCPFADEMFPNQPK